MYVPTPQSTPKAFSQVDETVTKQQINKVTVRNTSTTTASSTDIMCPRGCIPICFHYPGGQ